MSWKKINSILQTGAGIASIVGLAVVFITEDPIKGWIALSVVIAFLVYVAVQLTVTLHRLIKQKYPDGYIRLATHVRYTCIDGKTVEYEVQKIIQSKAPCLLTVEHGFKWSGTKKPEITCDLHEITAIRPGVSKLQFDTIVIQLREALLYNQVGVIPIKMVIDDSDHKSNTYVSHKIEVPTQVISWRIELGGTHDRSHSPARLTRCPIKSEVTSDWEFVRSVPYHSIHRCYEEQLLYPDPNYFYRLAWDRI